MRAAKYPPVALPARSPLARGRNARARGTWRQYTARIFLREERSVYSESVPGERREYSEYRLTYERASHGERRAWKSRATCLPPPIATPSTLFLRRLCGARRLRRAQAVRLTKRNERREMSLNHRYYVSIGLGTNRARHVPT